MKTGKIFKFTPNEIDEILFKHIEDKGYDLTDGLDVSYTYLVDVSTGLVTLGTINMETVEDE